MTWERVTTATELAARGHVIHRIPGQQILVIEIGNERFAIDHRCPHEGYPLSVGTIDSDRCRLTCNWHNWKFDLRTGAALVGQDSVRRYGVEQRGDDIFVDVTPPPLEEIEARIMGGLRRAFDDRRLGQIARELARLDQAGLPSAPALAQALGWAHDRVENGMTHAWAGMTDWLRIADGARSIQARLIPLTEALDHLADDVLRQPVFPYSEGSLPWQPEAFLAAVEREDEDVAIASLRGAFEQGLDWDALEPTLATAALSHYAGFGHPAIFTVKARELIDRLGDGVLPYVVFPLVRSFISATREDLLPEFRRYAPAVRTADGLPPAAQSGPVFPASFMRQGVKGTIDATLEALAVARPDAILMAQLDAAAWQLLHFDHSFVFATDNEVSDNVGWLDLTHPITFAAAVRELCGRHPQLWPRALLQMACFLGRNTPYVHDELPTERWEIEDPAAFFGRTLASLMDHGIAQPIHAVHRLKTTLAVMDLLAAGGPERLRPALNRYLSARQKYKHVRRFVTQAVKLVTT